jgi:predicted permease
VRHVRAAFARISGIFTKDRGDDDLRAELQSHLEMETDEYIRRGMSPAAARRKAMLASGGLTAAAESVRAQRGLPGVEGIIADARYAVRALRHSPAFTMVVVITLALGIGANTAIFSVVRGVLLKPLPHREGDRLVYLRQMMDGPGGANLMFSVPEIRDYREGVASLAGIAEYSPFEFNLQGVGATRRVETGLVTGNFFDVMGLSPVLGRLTRPSDDGVGVPAVLVLTHDFWRKAFGGDTSVVGSTVQLDGAPVTIVGVLQSAPYFPDRVDAFANMVVSKHHVSALMVQGRTHRMSEMIARLAPGARVEDVRADVGAVHARMKAAFRDAYDPGSNYRVADIPFREALGERARTPLWLLMGAAAFVMIISVANVVNLTLMRGVRREHELVLRAALGAGVRRLRRLLLVENLILTSVGAALGILIAMAGVRLLVSLADRYSPRASEIRLDLMVLAFTLALAVAVALLLSFAASLPTEGTLGGMVAAGGRRLNGRFAKQRLQRGLVVAQVAVSVVLLAGAGLLTRTMLQLADVSTGLKTEEVLSIQVPLLSTRQLDAASSSAAEIAAADAWAKAAYESMQREIRALPGVTEVGLGSNMPLQGSQVRFEVKAEGRVLAPGEPTPSADFRTANTQYFRAAGIPLLDGREFLPSDSARGDKVVIINQALAERLFGRARAVGQRIAWTGDILRFTPLTAEWRRVVGVVGDTRDGGLDAKPRQVLFMPTTQMLAMGGSLVIRADSNASALAEQATRIVRRIAPAAPIEAVRTIAQVREQSLAPRRTNAALISAFGVLAVIIAAVGIAGVLAFSVSARTNEIGVRMSLGADSGRVERMILKEGGVLLAIGLVVGVACAFITARLVPGLLFGVGPSDPVPLGAVLVMMGAVGLAACWIPALRAARIDPVIAMRT